VVYLFQDFQSYEYRILGHPDPDLRPRYDADGANGVYRLYVDYIRIQ